MKKSGIRVLRQSGLPIELEDLNSYKKKWEDGFDAIKNECGEDRKQMQERLQNLEDELKAEYGQDTRWKLVTTQKQMKEIVKEYGMIAAAMTHHDELVYLILDEGI